MSGLFRKLKLLNPATAVCTVALFLLTPASAQKSGQPRRPDATAKLIERAQSAQTVRAFVDRAKSFHSIQTRVITLVNLASLLWADSDQEQFARQIFVDLRDDLKLAATTQSKIGSGPDENVSITGLQQILLRYLARHDPKLAQSWLDEMLASAGTSRASRKLDFALDLAQDGNASARDFAGQAVDSDFSSLNLNQLLLILDRIRLLDPRAADSLFVQMLGRLTQQPQVSAEDLLLAGTYLFMNDADANPDALHYRPVRIDDLYFPVGISGERTGLSGSIVSEYLEASLTVLTHELALGSEVRFPRRYAAVAQMLALKSQKFAPPLTAAFSELARGFASSGVQEFRPDENASAGKPQKYDDFFSSLEKLSDAERDEKCLTLAASAYRQNDLAIARKAAELISDGVSRDRLRQLIQFRAAINELETGDEGAAAEAAEGISTHELRTILQLNLAAVEMKNKQSAKALRRLGGVLSDIRGDQYAARGLYLLTAARLLGQIEPGLAHQALSDAVKAFNDSALSVAELSRRDELTKIRIGKSAGSFSIETKVLPLANVEGPLVALFLDSPQEVLSTVIAINNERILGPALVVLAKQLLERKSTSQLESRKGTNCAY
jgi:hypothetical protein